MMNTNTYETENPAAPRLKNRMASPMVWQAMMSLSKSLQATSLEPSLLELVKLRASQINRCAFCIDMHFREAQAKGESADRLYLLDAWAEVDRYSPRERAALLWTESLTQLSEEAVSDKVFAAVSAVFSEAEMLELTLAIVIINGWNRFNVGFRMPPAGA